MSVPAIYNYLHHSAQAPVSTLDMILSVVKSFVSGIGTIVIVTGVIIALYRFIQFRLAHKRYVDIQQSNLNVIRGELGRTIVLGLEFIVAADIIETTTTPDYYSLGILAIIVLIRTFLSYALSKEISELKPAQQRKVTSS